METEVLMQLNLFLLVFMRMSGCVLLNPILGRKGIPNPVKAALSFVLAVTVYSVVQNKVPDVEINSVLVFAVLMIWEFFIGFVIGYIMQLIFLVMTWAGAIMDFLMGMSMATVYDPQNGQPVPISGSLLNIFMSLMFFRADGHLLLIKLILFSYQTVPYGTINLNFRASSAIPALFAECALMAVRFAFPILAAEFISEIAMGVLMKAVPQINIFVVNIQMKIVLGFTLMLFLVLPIADGMDVLLNRMFIEIPRFLQMLGG